MHRHHENIRLPAGRYVGQHRYFITACCAENHPVFANAETAAWLIDVLRAKSVQHKFAVKAYCAMPDHLHILIGGEDPNSDALISCAFSSNKPLTTTRKKAGVNSGRKNSTITSCAKTIPENP
jgi:REP element-mobilizing transposase RayT